MPRDAETLALIALSLDEYERIVALLDREPNDIELGMFGAMWSEHCAYKHSRLHLARLPSEGPRVLVGPGENAGALDIGHGLAVVFKVESHNHPSAVEPYQGAATGVGGIIRDIFTMGARPVALGNALRFGPLEAVDDPTGRTDAATATRNRYLFGGVVAGIAGYGNCIGIPDVAGEVVFDAAYSGNPLVNAMCVGVGRVEHLLSARSGVYHPASNGGDDLASAPPRGSQAPGAYYLYSNWDFNVAGAIFEQFSRGRAAHTGGAPGVGLGLSFVSVTIGAVAGTKPDEAGLASGLINTSQQIGGALGTAIVTSVAVSPSEPSATMPSTPLSICQAAWSARNAWSTL